MSNIRAIGIDEIAWQKGYKYLTLMYQIDAGCKRLLWVGAERSEETLKAFFRWFTKERTSRLDYICSDMWVRAYLLKEDFQQLWTYKSIGWARKFMDQWCRRTMRSRIEPMKDVARMIRTHQELILNWFEAKGTISAAVVEGLNNKSKVTIR